jgi:hypothetical protein
LTERKKGFIAEIRRRHRDLKVAAPTDSSQSDAIDVAERRRTELKTQLAEDPGWIARRRPRAGQRKSDK